MEFDLEKPIVKIRKAVGVPREEDSSKILRMTERVLLLGLLSLFFASTALAQQDSYRCSGYDAYVKCRQEQLKKSSALQGKTLAGAKSALYQLKSSEFQIYLTSEGKKQKHLQEVQANARKVKENVTKAVDKIILAYKRSQATMRNQKP